jgi:hypothetical protein
MREKKNQERDILRMDEKMSYFRFFSACTVLLFTIIIQSCTKDDANVLPEADPLKAAGITEIFPANLADSVVVNPMVTVTFKVGTAPSEITASTITVKQGLNSIPGTMTFKDNTAVFTTEADLNPDKEYSATIKKSVKGSSGSEETKEYSWKFKTGKHHGDNTLAVASVVPLNSSTAIAVTFQPTVTFNSELTPSMINSFTYDLYRGSSHIEGKVSFSGSTATFKPAVNFTANTVYTGKVKIHSRWHDDHLSDHNYTWSFTTANAGSGVTDNDVTPPVISSVVPVNSATAVPVNNKVTAVFSEAMNPLTINATTFTLKQNTTVVQGTITYSGNTATFTPAGSFAPSLTYSATISTGAKDVAGNALASNYIWSFTTAASTADVTAPTVLSVQPANGATSIAVNSKVTATFNEAMNASTITSSSFTLMQGTTSIAGSVSYSGTTATFTPTGVLTGNKVYTATITTAAKDVAGNALTSNYSWSFTTVATTPPVTGLSFATDVVPALNVCNVCHVHSWTTSSVASTFYTNLVSSGYVNAASYTTSKLYTKMNAGHPSSSMSADMTKIITWMSQGSKNN